MPNRPNIGGGSPARQPSAPREAAPPREAPRAAPQQREQPREQPHEAPPDIFKPAARQPEPRQPEPTRPPEVERHPEPEQRQPTPVAVPRQPEQRQPEQKQPETRKPEQRQPEQKQPEPRQPEQRQPEQRQPNAGPTPPRPEHHDGPTPPRPEQHQPNAGPTPPRPNQNPRPVTHEATQHNSDGGVSKVYTTNRDDGSKRVKTDTVGPNGQKSVRITTVDTRGHEVTARTRGVDSWTSRAPEKNYNQAVSTLRTGGTGYHRDVTFSTHVTDRTTIIINNNHYYEPPYRHENRGLGGFAGGFFAGYVAGAIDQAALDSYYGGFNQCAINQPYFFPQTVWQPYYEQVLVQPLPVIVQPEIIDYSAPQAWQTPPLDPTRDPLEQLAQFGQLQEPEWFGNSVITAEQARDRLNQGLAIVVGGVTVNSYDQLAQIVPEMANAQVGALTPDQQQAVGGAIAGTNGPSIDDTIANLPPFEQVYSPKALVAEDEINGQKINRTMDAAQAIYDRPEVKQAIAEWWQANPDADRSALNTQINGIVTAALVNDLGANRDQYAAAPDLEDNPVSYLQDPSTNPDAVAYNTNAINTVLNNAASELQGNLIVAGNN